MPFFWCMLYQQSLSSCESLCNSKTGILNSVFNHQAKPSLLIKSKLSSKGKGDVHSFSLQKETKKYIYFTKTKILRLTPV